MVDDRPSAGSHDGPRLGSLALLAGITLAAVLAIVGSWPWQGEALRRSPADASSATGDGQHQVAKYVGQAVCLECHAGESALQSRSGHNRTLRPAELSPVLAWLNGKSASDPRFPDVGWSYRVREGRLSVERTEGGRADSLALDYAVGSGKHGVTFVAIREDPQKGAPSGIEHRLSVFPDGPRLAITPGQERSTRVGRPGDAAEGVAFGVEMGPDHLRQCLGCHATWISPAPRHRLAAGDLIPNVTCERCHGPGRDHVAAARRGDTDLHMPMGSDPAPAWAEVNQCGECHRLPRVVSSSAMRPENPGIVRFQGVGISLSACYAKGFGGLRCTTCHDPHDRASSDHARYEAACLSCHQSAGAQKACPVSPASNCVECHMPRREVGGNGRFTDHWIRKPTSTRPATPKDEAARTSAAS